MNILDSFEAHVGAHPRHPAIVRRGKTITYGQLWRSAGNVARMLQEQGVRKGDCVALSRLAPAAYVAATMAIAWIGGISTVVQDEWPREKRDKLMRIHGVSAWVVDGSNLQDSPDADAIRIISAKSLFELQPADAAVPELVRGLDDQPWRIALSSGTTGESKSIAWTHRQLSEGHRRGLDIYPCGPGERLLVFADIAIGLAMGHTMLQLKGGGAVVFSNSGRPADFFATCQSERPTRALVTTAGAYALLAHVAEGQGARMEPLPLLSLLIGGATVSAALRRGLEHRVCANLVITYGSTETGTLARIDVNSFLSYPHSAGRIVPGVDAQAVDEEDRVLPPGEIGQLRFRTSSMATGYLGDPEASAKAFREGWYYSGDLGCIDALGNLMLAGRADDVLNLQGVKVNAAHVAQVLDAQPGVLESAVTAVEAPGGRQVLVAAIVPAGKVDAMALKRIVREKLGKFSVPERIVEVKSLPKNAGGKVLRRELQAMLSNLAPVAEAGKVDGPSDHSGAVSA